MKTVTLTMNPSLDRSVKVERVVPEKKLRCSRARHEPGGGGINVSRAMRQLGGDSLAVYPSGGDTGRYLDTLLEKEDVTHQRIPIEGWTRLNVSVEETATQQDYRFVMPGPDLTEAEWQACLEGVMDLTPDPDCIVISGSLAPGVPTDFYARIARRAKQRRLRVVLDTSGQPLIDALDEGVYMIKPNIVELRALVGGNLDTEHEQNEVAMKLVRDGRCEVVLASLGAGGALLATADGTRRFRSPTVPIRSRVGAGDSAVAGFVHAITQGLPVEEAALCGVAAGAAAVMTPGSELCRREDALRLIMEMKSDAPDTE